VDKAREGKAEAEGKGKHMTMTKTLEQMMKEVSPARRKKIERRAAQLIAEEMSLRELRRAHKLTQERLAETLKIGQDQVSRLEQRSDLLISTLRSYIEAMGGTLTLLAEFPHRKPVVVAGLSTLGPDSPESSPMAPSRVSAKQKRVAFGMTFERTETGRSRTSRQALAVRS
jgi:hypothetical protein